MSFTFFNELGVEPLAYVGQPTDIKITVTNVIHRLYSGDKLNVLTRYTCGRYINTPEESRLINTEFKSRYINTKKGDCK